MTLKERFRGRELWRTINNAIIFITYVVTILVFLLFPRYFWHLIIGLAIFFPTYAYLFEHHLREREGEVKGQEVIGGWAEHYHKVGEPYYLYVKDIQPKERLSDADQKAVDGFVKMLTEKAKKPIRVPIGTKKPEELEDKEEHPPQLTFQEFDESEKEFMERMKEEFKVWKSTRFTSSREDLQVQEDPEVQEDIIENNEEDENAKK
ncbi:MAG: hypothetical protein ACFFDF_13840 [Candidatus Odinarchaeota archaeon]